MTPFGPKNQRFLGVPRPISFVSFDRLLNRDVDAAASAEPRDRARGRTHGLSGVAQDLVYPRRRPTWAQRTIERYIDMQGVNELSDITS